MGLHGKHVGEGSLTPHIDVEFDDRVEEYVCATGICRILIGSTESYWTAKCWCGILSQSVIYRSEP